MIGLAVLLALVVAAPLQGGSTESQTAIQQRAKAEYERHKQIAIRINELAERIHSEADANALVSEIADLFGKELPPPWSSSGIHQRVAHAEFETIGTPARLIPEQRIVDVWNQYVREIGAPDEAIVSTAEIHNMRDAQFTVAQSMWARGIQTIWTMPNIYALGPDGKVADGCRAVEALRVIHDLDSLFQNLRGARDRLQRGIVQSEEAKKRASDPNQHPRGSARLEAHVDTNPVRPAEQRYLQKHGPEGYRESLARLFDQLFPPE
jgi:hypothetical protein